MELSEPKLISPMLDNFTMGESISDHHGVRCYPAMPNDSDRKYIVKVVSIPASQVQAQALLLTGAYPNEESVRNYYRQLADGVAHETEILANLAKMEGFLPFEDCQIVPQENGIGYEVYLLSNYGRTLARQMRKSSMTHLAAVNLGLDLCASLAVARQAGYLFTGLKPENIFVCNDKEYRIGDIGFLRLDSLKYASLPDRCIGTYTAPEVQDAYSDVNSTLDIYAVGLILYQVYNGGVLPFENRVGPEPLPMPEYADYEMAEIIMKACAPDPKDRWEDPVSMGQALVAYMQRNSVNDTPIVTAVEDHSNEIPMVLQAESPEDPAETVTDDVAEEITPVALPEEDPPEQLQLDEFIPEANNATASDDQDEIPDIHVDFEEAPEPVSMDVILPDEDASASDEDELLNLSFLDEMLVDDTSPSEEMAVEFQYDAITTDASDILAQADELLLHETPGGVVAPEPVDIDTIEPATTTPDIAETINISIGSGAAVAEQPAVSANETQVITMSQTANAEEDDASVDEDDEDYDEDDEEYESNDDSPEDDDDQQDRKDYDLVSRRSDHRRMMAKKKARRSKVIRRWIVAFFVLLLLGGLALGGYLFYQNYYLCSIISLVPSGSEDRLVVSVTADIDEQLLTVYCIDTHGNSKQSSVVNGQATFEGLTPNTLYTLKVEVSGLHRLIGETGDSYTTPVQTEILTFSAITGSEPGSAILSFTVEGMDADTWIVTYSAEGVEEDKKIFSGHMVNINGLIAGKTYTFTLTSANDLYIVGENTLEYNAMDPVFAQNLAITGATQDSLDVRWEAPVGTNVEYWIVRCYSDSGYDETVETSVPYVTFRGLDGNEAHTVEVTANGMSAGTRCYMTDNAVTVTDISAAKAGVNELKLTWNFTGNTPEGPWLLTYSVDGSAQESIVRADTNSAVISPLIPGAEYTISLILEDGTTVFSYPLSVTTEEAVKFTGYYTGAAYITASMCLTPSKTNWSRLDLKQSDYTDTFKIGQKGSFLLYTSRKYDTARDLITTMFVIHDAEGKLISSNITQQTWVNMWYQRYCELDIPALPEVPGTYTITIYFNGMFVHTQEFTIVQ